MMIRDKVIVVGGITLTLQEFIVIYGGADVECIGEPVPIDDVRNIELTEDCKPEVCIINDNQSWQQMNRGVLSKKQRRK